MAVLIWESFNLLRSGPVWLGRGKSRKRMPLRNLQAPCKKCRLRPFIDDCRDKFGLHSGDKAQPNRTIDYNRFNLAARIGFKLDHQHNVNFVNFRR
jgi:hypothetical protein